jgi:alanyl-tRNA synthetase
MDGLMEIFECHKTDLAGLYGEFPDYKSFRSIIEIEYERWMTTADKQKRVLKKMLKKKKGKLKIDDWIHCLTSEGIPAEVIAEVTGIDPPSNLHSKIAE